ncbi:collectin-11 [Plakobranchus ocellatus]|uniref:Collectin-11 n=1 Tax=Plakobranchus ocellatus TaxID=259542 RepID=A0AAV4BLB7_9GAST|nr:collectin-11 [Plakobranchus ocellatus]
MLLIAFAVFTASLACSCQAGEIEDTCPPDLVNTVREFLQVLDDVCYQFVNSSDSKVQFREAQKICEDNGGSLAMPKTEKINDFLVEKLLSYGIQEEAFIGLDDFKDENEFRWLVVIQRRSPEQLFCFVVGVKLLYLGAFFFQPFTFVFRWHDGEKLKQSNFYENFGKGKGIYRKKGFFNSDVFNDCVTLNPVTNAWQDLDCGRSYVRVWAGWKKERLYICQYLPQEE